MAVKIIIKKNAYQDSVALMSISSKITAIEGVSEAVVSMATEMNKELLNNVGMLTAEVAVCDANDLIIAIQAGTETVCDEAVNLVEELMSKHVSAQKGNKQIRPTTISSAIKQFPESNLAVISVPGVFAAREAKLALKQGMHVMLFSDNVTVAEEKELKEYAHDNGLLVMGPDCGTAIINNVGLCFANAVAAGNIGIVGASGTGTQEVTVLIDRFGGGISQAIGTGGRDLSEELGGIMMFDGLQALADDSATKVIVLVSKPPAPSVADKVLAKVKECPKPVVVCFINGEATPVEAAGAYFGRNLEDTARKAVKLAKGEPITDTCDHNSLITMAKELKSQLKPEQKYVRGLFCGGTLCDESMFIVHNKAGHVYSNVAKKAEMKLKDPYASKGNSFIDLGDDTFTIGKPHPMIEPSLRLPRIIQEAKDPEVGIILMDIMLGYGSHSDPAGITLPAIQEAQQIAAAEGRKIIFIAYVCGTDRDKQNMAEQERKLRDAGVILAKTNARAAYLAAEILA